MALVYLLEIDHPHVGSYIELIKNIFDENGISSRPHITVRYAEKLTRNLAQYESLEVEELQFDGVGDFGLSEDDGYYVVFIKCSSEVLETFSYKPHYPDSVFHITVYSGPDKYKAKAILDLLCLYDWNFLLKFPVATKLKKKIVGERSTNSRLSNDSLKLWRKIYGTRYCAERIQEKELSERVYLARNLLDYMFSPDGMADNDIDYSHSSWWDNDQMRLNFSDSFFEWEGKFKKANDYEGASFLTPPELAIDIAKYLSYLKILGEEDIRFGDPAVGTGTLFAAALNIFKERMVSGVGVEINDSRALETSRKWSMRNLRVISGDFFKTSLDDKRNLIIANPPYMRYQSIDSNYRKELQYLAERELKLNVDSTSNLYVYFILLSHNWLDEGGVAAWLIPGDFVNSVSGRVLRKYFLEHVKLVRIHMFSNSTYQFENAQVSSCVVIFEKTKPSSNHVFVYTEGDSLLGSLAKSHIPISDLPAMSGWGPTLSGQKGSNSSYVFGDIFEVKRGIATGANDFFLLSKEEVKELQIPPQMVKKFIPSVKKLDSSYVIDNSYENFVYLLDVDCGLAEIKQQSVPLYNYIMSNEERLSTRNLISRRNPWYKQEVRRPPLFFCSNMGRGVHGASPIRFYLNSSEALASNSYIMVYLKSELSVEELSRSYDLKKLLNYLNTIVAKSAVSLSKVYGGGLKKIEPSTLKEVPLVDVPEELMHIIEISSK